MFGFIKNLFSGIFAFFGGLLSGGKKSGYYLELKEDDQKPSSSKPATQPKAKAPEPAASKPATPTKAPEPVAAQAPAPAPQPKAPAPAPTPTVVATKIQEQPLLNGYRRRPGPSMDYFMDMARQAKTR